MEQAGTKWNDDRLDHLSGQVDSVRDLVNALQHHIDNRFDRLQNAMIVTLASILAFGGAIVAIRF
jgi:ribosome assembly protein YihI (activator of Der GTPase)